MIKVLVTGGGGFIGGHLVAHLLDDGYYVTVIDNLERGIRPKPHPNLIFSENDLENPGDWESLFDNQEILIHLASKVGGIGVYLNSPYEVFIKNTSIDANVLKAAKRHGIKNIVYASSAHIYPLGYQMSRNNIFTLLEPDSEPASPGLSYGWGKFFTEKMLEFMSAENKDMSIKILRYVGIYGPGQDFDLSTGSVIPVFCHRAIRYPNLPFKIYGTGEETRTYCYIKDAIDATILTMNSKASHMVLNIGTDEVVSINDIAERIIALSGKKIDVEYIDEKTFIWSQVCGMRAANMLLGWTPKVSFSDGIRACYSDIEKRIGQFQEEFQS